MRPMAQHLRCLGSLTDRDQFMAINFIEFASKNEKVGLGSDSHNKAVTVSNMNSWLDKNSGIRVISVETMEVYLTLNDDCPWWLYVPGFTCLV
jgi:hypothetical protein